MDRIYYKEATISTDSQDGTSVFNFNEIFDTKACEYFYIQNDDDDNFINMLLTDVDCYPGSDDIKIKAGETWPPHPIVGFRCSGFRLVANTQPVKVRIFAMA